MKLLGVILIAAVLAVPMQGEPAAALRMEFSNPGLIPPAWSLLLRPDGTAHFHSERGNADAGSLRTIEPATVDREVQLSKQFTGWAFDIVQRHHQLRDERCESHMKVAFQGWKKLTYTGPDGSGACEFNYSKDKEIQSLGESLLAVASTILEGARVELLLQHDPLGLDHELEFIQESAHDGRLQQICAIRGVLQRVEEDPAIMERARRRAQSLLAESTQ